MVETELIVKKDLREQMIERVEALEKVKKLMLIPKINLMTTQQVSDYYEVGIEAISSCYKRNKDEIDEDGAPIISLKSLKVHFEPTKIEHGKCVFQIGENITLEVPNRGIKCFSKRAVLRIGMLLRDSKIAKEVRTQLLNTFEHSTTEQRTVDIDEEMKLQSEIGKAYMTGDPQEIMLACTKAMDYKNRHIIQLKENNNELVANNKALAGDILKWEDRACLNKAIRKIAGVRQVPFGYIWKELYDELLYKHSIGLSLRGKPPYIQHIKENEWELVMQSLSAICENSGVSVSKIMKAAKLE